MFFAALLLAGVWLCLPRPVWAGWASPGGVRVTTGADPLAHILPVADGNGGAFVLTLHGLHLLVHHVDAQGNLAPGWPTEGADVCSTGTTMGVTCSQYSIADLSAVPDGAGGVYVAWRGPPLDNATQIGTGYAQHLGADGNLVAGWPAAGRAVSTGAGQDGLFAYADGSGGVFLLWRDIRRPIAIDDEGHVVLQHLLANGVRAPGFAALGRVLGATVSPGPSARTAAKFTADPAGGAWALVTRTSQNPIQSPSGFVVLRIDESGLVASGSGDAGLALPGPSSDVLSPAASVRLFNDGSGGAWVIYSSPSRGKVTAFALTPDGSFDPALTAGGLDLAAATDTVIEPDGVGGFFERVPGPGFERLALRRLRPDGGLDSAWTTPIPITGWREAQLFPTADGVVACGWSVYANGTCAEYAGDGLLGRLSREGTIPADWLVATEPGGYGAPFGVPAAIDVSTSSWEFAAAACRDDRGGFLVFWTVSDGYPPRVRGDVEGMRFTLQGAVADVAPGRPGRLQIRGARFTPSGFRLILAGSQHGDAELGIFDLLGRQVGGARIPIDAVPADVIVPGTTELQPGVYFLRVEAGTESAQARAVVVH